MRVLAATSPERPGVTPGRPSGAAKKKELKRSRAIGQKRKLQAQGRMIHRDDSGKDSHPFL